VSLYILNLFLKYQWQDNNLFPLNWGVRAFEGILGLWLLTSHHCLDVFPFVIPNVGEDIVQVINRRASSFGNTAALKLIEQV
jgi:hypothetical protein